MKRLPLTGTAALLDLLDPYIPDDFINQRWPLRPARGPRWKFSAAQLWRIHLLALLTPVHSLNLLCAMLGEQRAWRTFARLRHRHRLPDARLLHAFRASLGVAGLRQINEALLEPFIQRAAGWENATALIDATDLPAACGGFKKNTPAPIPPAGPPWAGAPSRADRAVALSVTRSTASGGGGAHSGRRSCSCRWSVG